MRYVSGNVALLLEFFSGETCSFYSDKRGQMTQHPVLQALPRTGTEPDASLYPVLTGVGAGSLGAQQRFQVLGC